MPSRSATDHRVAALAGRQHGVVTRQQLLALDLSPSMVVDRMRAGRLHPVHRGVYAVGHDALGREGRLLAAVLACGPRAALSHRSAAAVWGFGTSGGRRIDVTVRSTGGRQGPRDVRLRRSGTLRDEDVTTEGALPITTPARTLLDLAGVLVPQRLESAVRRADELELFDLPAVTAAIDRAPRHRGAAKLRHVLAAAAEAGLTLTLSDLEDRFRALCAAHALPAPAVNGRIAGRRRDFTWHAERLVVETDGWAYHRGRRAFERDRARDQELVAAGYRVLRFTHRQVAREPGAVAATIRRALELRVG
ncbi:MAG TPA: type IV toxin-antitoxin system AbiEi family antitoxin domain-containing protein [Baekduia sp.]|nr:type IV toxin-antitoxin system AbiEi family antitoxin domain-containing protein [Baekduia sp.]